jgi:hypothetical protein
MGRQPRKAELSLSALTSSRELSIGISVEILVGQPGSLLTLSVDQPETIRVSGARAGAEWQLKFLLD